MLQFLVLAILCGLLAQNAQGDAIPQAIVSFSPELLQHLISEQMGQRGLKGRLQKLPLQDAVKSGMKRGGHGGLFPLLTGLLDNVLGNILGVKIKNVELLKLDIRFDEREKHIFVIIPADLEVEINLPLSLGRLLHVKLYLDIQVGITIETTAAGRIRMMVGNCQNNPGHLRITVFKNDDNSSSTTAINNLLRMLTNIVEKTVPHILQKELCPLVNGVIETVLNLLQGSLSSHVGQGTMELSADAFSLHSGVMELGYQAEMHLPGGQNFKVPLVSTPLPHAPLNGSPMNMLLSGNLLNVLLLALVPPQAFTVPKKELNRWSQAGAFRFVIPQASNAQMMQIAHRVLLLLIEPGKVQVQQNIEMRLYGDHPRGAYQVLLAIRASVNSVAGVSADNGRLKLTLGLQGISNISVIRSSIRNVDAEHLTGIIRQLVSTLLLPRQNQLLAEGMPLPLVGNLGVHHLGVAPGHNVLKLFIPPSLRSAQAPVAV